MQKPANRILGALLVLVMIITMLPATVFATSETDVFAGWSLTLGEDIGVNFYLSQTAADYTVDITVAGNEAAYTTATKDGYYVVSVNVAAAQMTDLITLTVTNGEQVMHTGEYSVRQYAEIILTGAYDDEVKQMAKQMLNLGAAAQTYFAYNTGILANKDYEIDTPAAVPTEVPAIALEDNLDGVSLYGMSLLFQSKTAVRFYFVVDGNVADYTFKVKETEYTPVKKDDLYYVEVGNINPQDLGSEITVTVNDALTVSYNPLTYIVRKYNSDSTSAALKNLVQALYGYHLEALEYQEYQRIIQVGALQQHSNNTPWVKSDSETFIYFNTDAYTATTGEYTSLTADAIKLVRGGEVYSVANPGQGLLVKDTDTQHLLKITPWGMTGGHLPIQAHDYFIIEGRFESTSGDGTTIQIAKSYVYFDGTNVEISTTEPILPTTIDAGTMSAHSTTGWNSSADAAGNLLFAMADNDAPTGYYRPTDASNVQLIRGGNTYVVGHNLRDTISKENNAQYVFEFWTIADHKPMVANDILVVEGDFYQESTKTMLNISKTYILLNADGSATFSTEMPTLATVIDAGVMGSHSNGWNADALYFSMAENEAPVGDAIRYTPTAASNIKLIRDGVTYDVGHTARETIVKSSDTGYYIALWVLGDYKPLVANDILVVEGNFTNAANNTTLNISKSYVLINADGTASFSTEMPALKTVVDAGAMSAHADGSASGIYFSLSENAVPVDENAETAYAGSVQLVRSGAVSTVSANIYKLDEGYYYLELDGVELADGDYLVVEGAFSNANNGYTMNITKTYVLVDGETLVYSETEPVLSTAIDAGSLSNHSNGINGTNGIYATMTANSAPYDGWSIEYAPLSADSYYVIRGGEQINIGIPGRGTLVKYSDTEYYLKLTQWCTNNFAFTTSDIFVIEGLWKQNTGGNATLKIEKTYLYYNGSAWTFATELPTVVNGGTMQSHNNGMSGTGIYFKLNANDAPYNGWNYEYKQTATSGIKLIRDGATIDIGIVDRPLFVKYSDTEYYLKLEKWTIGEYGVNGGTMAITTDDVIIVEGNFVYENVTLNVTKSYVYYNGSAWVCSAEAPVQKNIVDVVDLGSHSNGWKSGGFYFTAAANDAPLNTDWSLRYKPVSADVIKCISGDTTTNVGNTGGETIVKYSETEYYVEGWAVGSANLAAGNTFVIEGQFYNAANDVYIDVEKTYIILNADGTTTVLTDADKYINAGAMSAYTQNWFNTNYTALYFVLESNNAPADEGWSVRYKPASANNVKLVRDGTTYTIGNTGAETIVKITDGKYALALDSWWWSAYAPIRDGDQLIIEGEFSNASNGYILNITKTYITFVSNAEDNVIFNAAADTEFGDVLLPSTNDTLTIGVWNGSYHVFEDQQLKELKAAGITKIMGIDTQWIGTTDVNAWLDRVYSYGISVIMDLRSWDGETVPAYASHPGVLGFLMYDEPCATEFDNLADLKAKFDAVMPADKLFYVNLFPSCAAKSSLYGGWTIGKNYETHYVQQFLDKLGVEVLSWDNYSLLDGNGIRTDYFYNFEVMASKTAEKWYTMLSSGHSTTTTSYATPTADELRWQMAVAMTYGVQNIDHYTYVSHEDDYSCMVEYDTWKPTALYYDILQVDNEYLAWDNIYMAYNWIGVGTYSANSNNSMLTQLENSLNLANHGITATSASENLLIGVFENNGNKAYMVTNAGSAGSTTVGDGKNFSMADTSVTLTLAAGDYKCAAVIDNGEITYVAVNNNQVTLNVEAYEGVFVIPVLN